MKLVYLQLSALLQVIVLSPTYLQAEESDLQPIAASHDDIDVRRDSIHRELDANQNTVKDLYGLLDATPEDNSGALRFLEVQIRQFDDRSSVLFEELDVIDRHEFQQDRRHDLKLQSQRLDEEAKQFRTIGYIVLAALREAKAKSIRKSLDDGTWKLLVGEEWTCNDDPAERHAPELLIEMQKLKSETAALRQEVKLLRELVAKITNQPAQMNQKKLEKTVPCKACEPAK